MQEVLQTKESFGGEDADTVESTETAGESDAQSTDQTSTIKHMKLFDAKFERHTERLWPPIALVISALSWKLAVSASTW